ncbi:DUF892 family protein [Roseicitreum antarcticum]|uniref:Ferritin-like metal-binding protein YciE n=1 Tax=Roseicitreum antarcticum TaxID=564137 RepID=A0A1H2YTR7_9RHOB|nr:DUF892 family protein [Roseicitreum antarcticum]SDX08536.1 Ferritin-like metal-binding protein YciE [Roseicitreum antarcticum]
MNNLKEVYLDQLKDLHSANKQSRDSVRQLSEAASSDGLRRALDAGAAGIADGMSKLETLLAAHDTPSTGTHCKGMEGLVREARAHALKEEFTEGALRDAVIVTQYQRMAHYAIAGYGCAAAFATQLGLTDQAATLKGMLDSAYSGDHTMTELAESGINAAAA